jgi:hypothetical protein
MLVDVEITVEFTLIPNGKLLKVRSSHGSFASFLIRSPSFLHRADLY